MSFNKEWQLELEKLAMHDYKWIGRFKGDWAKLVGVVTGETLDLPPLLLSFGDFRIAKDSKEFLSIAAEVKFSRRDPRAALATTGLCLSPVSCAR